MGDLFAEIRKQHIEDYGSKFEEWAPRILVDQYSDRTHFIYELIQNAEDAGATYLTFNLYPDRLVLCHNGKPFTEADIRGICGIRSTKDEPDSGKIGRFGIGFKSVYAYTKTPAIYSGQYAFRIQNLILPYAENNISSEGNTVLILPFDGNVNADVANCDIEIALRKYISSDVLFALHNIKKIGCKVYPTEEEWTIVKQSNPLSEFVDHIHIIEEPYNEEKELLVFHTTDSQPILIGYRLAEAEDGKKYVIPANQHYLYVFFPTSVETHLSFYIHAPFSTTPARDNVRHNEINKVLSKQLNQLFADSIKWLLEHGYVTLKFLNNVYPLEDDCREETLQGLYYTGKKLFEDGVRLLQTEDNDYCSVPEAVLPYAKNIPESITQEILQSENKNRVCWVKADVCTEAYARLWEYLTHTLGIKVLRWRDVLPKLGAEILEKQSDEWLLHLLDVIYPTCTGFLKLRDKVDARTIPLVRLQDGRHICCQYDGVAQVYINNPISCKNKIRDSILYDESGFKFYTDALGIGEYNAVQELKDDVVCFYGEDSEDTDIPFEDNIEHFSVIKRALKENETEVRKILKNVPIVLSNAGWMPPTACYLPDEMVNRTLQESQLLHGVNLKWVSDRYKEYVAADVFKKIGCNVTLKSIQVDKRSYLELLSQYDPDLCVKVRGAIFNKTYTEIIETTEPEIWNWSFAIDHIGELLSEVSPEKSLEIVDYLDDVVKSHPLYGTMRGANDRNFNGKSVATLGNIPSALAVALESAKWLYDADGTAKIASELKRSELHAVYTGHGRKLFAQLNFIEENEAVEAAIQSVDTPYQDFVSTMLKKPDELRWMYEAYQKFQKKKMKEEQQPKSLIQVLESQSSEQTEIDANSAPDDETLGEYGAVRNVNRREKKLEESFQEGLEGTTAVAPRLHYVYSESNQGEKAFLAAQYYGKCQICGKQIFRSNGKPYFEACNILPTNAIPDRYKHSISEGWNSLCLCPNCAAEFKYGKKNLSELISMIQDYHVKENDENLITCRIEMQGEQRTIKYTGKHFLALQKAIEYYSDDAK